MLAMTLEQVSNLMTRVQYSEITVNMAHPEITVINMAHPAVKHNEGIVAYIDDHDYNSLGRLERYKDFS